MRRQTGELHPRGGQVTSDWLCRQIVQVFQNGVKGDLPTKETAYLSAYDGDASLHGASVTQADSRPSLTT
jgi:hypothetical protein